MFRAQMTDCTGTAWWYDAGLYNWKCHDEADKHWNSIAKTRSPASTTP